MHALRYAAAMAALFLIDGGSVSCAANLDFYQASPQELQGKPGTVIRQEPMSGAPLDAKAWRVLYRSTGLNGEPIAVSGVIIVPTNPAPATGRPIVAWAHPTSGIVQHCAPSLAFFVFQQMQGLRTMVSRGYIVAATDYPGLGTPGPHPYLVGESEARAVLDSVRAARVIAGKEAGHRAAFWGHSQGGQAVLYAGILAKSYAPELAVVGVAAAAPATDLGALMRADIATAGGKNLLAMTLWSWDRVFNAPMKEIVDSAAIPEVDKLANICLESVVDMRPRKLIGQVLLRSFLKVDDPTRIKPWQTLLAQNTVGTLPPAIPVFIAQGTVDDTVDPPVTASYVKQLCAKGSSVRVVLLPGVGHGMVAHDSAGAAVDWMTDRFANAPVPNDCGKH